ncbi:CehA/McbA family metallohydrolase [Prosthecobacter fluviatilis]|uniref:CehA/McbA family metallohydrolase n=1 Tax=Prosthecobacter fluviatilis TaxID=445931 RepID=A0ABW0KW90_9BACT
MPAKIARFLVLLAGGMVHAADLPPVIETEGQPLAANAQRLVQALDFLGAPLPPETRTKLQTAITARDGAGVQSVLDPQVLCVVDINPESRVKAQRGPAAARLQQAGYTPLLIKVINHATSVAALHISSPQAGPSYAGVAKGTMERERQTHLRENENTQGADRFLEVGLHDSAPMTANLSGLEVEYAIALVYSSESGKREATLAFDIGQGTQDLGFRAEVPVLFQISPAVTVKLDVKDHDGKDTTARLTFTDAQGRVFPPQARRLAPDFFFQKHLYRASGGSVLLPPREFVMEASRGPEYRTVKTKVTIPSAKETTLPVKLERWMNAADFGYYSGDHHIHAAGCAHYTTPSEGMRPEDMFQQVKGEGLNVGCVLAWGYCFDYQRQFFGPQVDQFSEPLTQMKYDMEVSGFGSAALGHVCLLNLRELVYPGAEGIKGWPTWTLPALRWTKQQGGFTGYPHSGSGMQVNAGVAARRLLGLYDTDKDARLSAAEAQAVLLPEPFDKIDADRDDGLNEAELANSHERVLDALPNVAIPDAGGHEIFVTTAHGVCDFISTMDTARLLEWNAWYHLMNCGFPLKAAGETDFPCMSGTRVGQGRTYVKLGKVDRIDFTKWCEGLAQGRSYVSDGYAHALDFMVAGQPAGDEVRLAQPGRAEVRVKVAFSSETPLEIAYGGAVPVAGARLTGDTVNYHDVTAAQPYAGGKRKVELVVNGLAVATREVPADDQVHEIRFNVDIPRSSWVAVRQFPQMHTNPVNVIVADKPIRASRRSAQWCLACIEQLWRMREKNIAPAERDVARRAYEAAKEIYRRIAAEAPAAS